MHLTRDQVCDLTSRKLADAVPQLGAVKATIGLDGFVDEIIAVVDQRTNHEHFEPVRTIDALGQKIRAAAGESSNYELVVKQMKLGGNGPIMANALANLGLAVTYVGNLGYPNIHPVFADMVGRMKAVHSIGEPAHTDALEFDDGKLMLGKLSPLHDANWDNLIRRVGKEKLTEILAGSRLIAMLNWTMLPHMTRVWTKLLDEIIPNFEQHNRFVFIDLCDPEKRTEGDIIDAMRMVS